MTTTAAAPTLGEVVDQVDMIRNFPASMTVAGAWDFRGQTDISVNGRRWEVRQLSYCGPLDDSFGEYVNGEASLRDEKPNVKRFAWIGDLARWTCPGSNGYHSHPYYVLELRLVDD